MQSVDQKTVYWPSLKAFAVFVPDTQKSSFTLHNVGMRKSQWCILQLVVSVLSNRGVQSAHGTTHNAGLTFRRTHNNLSLT